MLIRFDDISVNSDLLSARLLTDWAHHYLECQVMWCISPLVHDLRAEPNDISRQRCFPAILRAYSDHRRFFRVDRAGVPDTPTGVLRAAHGLIHVDHRLLGREAQELSILASCSLARAEIFVPPFNKWNADTASVCDEHGIKLIRFEDGWLSMEHNSYDPAHELWYLHPREWTPRTFSAWFGGE